MKLAEYYATEGATDPIVVKIPKGNYHVVFEWKQTIPHPQASPAAEEPVLPPSTESVPAPWRFAVVALSLSLIVALAVLLSLALERKQSNAAVAVPSTPAVPAALGQFWRPFLSDGDQPWVIFSNAAFVGRPESGMRYYNSHLDSNTAVYDHYTGVGEVLAVHALDDVFSTLGRQILVKRGSLFTLDDASNANLIFVGSPSENLSLLDIPGTQEYVFKRVESGARKGDLSIVSRHPKAGESSNFVASPSGAPLTEDYAVIGLVPGMRSGRFVMILAGTTTFGTQGAVEFVSRPDSLVKLLRRIPGSSSAMKPFEALVRVKIARGVPLDEELIGVRVR
jgi:hypothetical protein